MRKKVLAQVEVEHPFTEPIANLQLLHLAWGFCGVWGRHLVLRSVWKREWKREKKKNHML